MPEVHRRKEKKMGRVKDMKNKKGNRGKTEEWNEVGQGSLSIMNNL